MGSLMAYLRSLRSKPRSFHVGLVLALAWVPLLIHFAGYSVVATIVLAVFAVVFFTIHPVTFTATNPPADREPRPPAANDE
jgi:ABC-type nitrate/sulfonate/bicarbonate transport system permease component